MLRILVACLTLAVSACASKHELAKCSGPAVALNPGKWQPTPQQQAEMDRLVKEACR
jgi:hypothetical protein